MNYFILYLHEYNKAYYVFDDINNEDKFQANPPKKCQSKPTDVSITKLN